MTTTKLHVLTNPVASAAETNSDAVAEADSTRVSDSSPAVARLEPAARAEPAAPRAPAAEGRAAGRRPGRLLLPGVAALALVAAGAWYGHDYWTVGRFHISTDDAYVKADTSAIAPKVSGYITQVFVSDNQTVTAGQPLAKIDDRDLATALEQARADVAAAEATLHSRQAALDIQQSAIAAARATVEVDKANEVFAEQNDKRYSSLVSSGSAPVLTAQQAASAIAVAKAVVMRDEATLEAAVRQVEQLTAEIAQAKAAFARGQALQHQAELNLSYTTILAPIGGTVGNRTLRVGQYVQAGTQLMSIVPTEQAYVIANYKETQLTDVRVGQKVEIEVDTFPGRSYAGRVDSIAPASGQEFALLPPDNATGNFTKVVQRIPVKIVLDGDAAAAGDLRPGMSVLPSIDTRSDAAGHGA